MRKIYTLLSVLFIFCGAEAQDYKFGKVSKEEVLEQAHPKDPEANAAVLFREHKTYYELRGNTGLTLVTEIHERIKIYNKDGFDWANKEIVYYKNGSNRESVSSIKGATYSIRNGRLEEEKLRKDGIFEEEISDYQEKTTLTMPAVSEGSVIEYRYSLRSPFLTSIDMVPLQYTIPINRLEAKVSIPEFFGFKQHINPKAAFFPEIQRSTKNFSYSVTNAVRTHQRYTVGHTNQTSKIEYVQNIYEVTRNDIPALKEEAYIDYLQNYAAFLKWELEFTKFPNSTMEFFSQSWDDVTKGIYDEGGYSKEFGRTNFFKDDVDAAIAGVTDPTAKAARIFNLVKRKVKWNDYLGYSAQNGGRSAYKEGEGNVADINLLLTAMLKYAGLDSNPVLVSTQSNGIPLFPTRSGFNYVISSVELPNQVLLLDATDPTSAPGDLPRRVRNWQGRIVRENGSSAWVNLMPQYQSQQRTLLNIKMEEDLSLSGKAVNLHNGLYAKVYRDKFAGINEANYLEMLQTGKGDIAITNVEKENTEVIGEDVKESFEFELQNGIDMINGKIYLQPLLFLAMKENPFKANERTYPIFFEYPSVQANTVNLMIPEGYTVESLPESVISELNNGAGTFKFITTLNGNFLRVQSELDLKHTVYTPKDYEALKKFYATMIEKQTEAVVISKI